MTVSIGDEDTVVHGRRLRRLRLLLLIVVMVGLYYIADRYGVREHLTVASIRQRTEEAGVLGVIVSLGLYSIRDPIRIPALVLNLAMVVAYGQVWGGVMAVAGTNLSVNACFIAVRTIGGKWLSGVRHARVQRLLARLDARPVLTVFVTRHVFLASSTYNCVLAMSNIHLRDYAIGSFLGLLLPTVLTVLAFEWLIGLVS